jgi:hypothetical protein
VLRDPSNYALAAITHVKVSPDTSLRATLHTDTLQHVPASLNTGLGLLRGGRGQGHANTSTSSSNSSTAAAGAPHAAANGAAAPPVALQTLGPASSTPGAAQSTATPATLAVQLRHKLEGLDLTADLAVNELAVDGVRRYSSTPLRMSVDLAPPSKRLQGLMYRIGLQGVLVPRQLPGGPSAAVGVVQGGSSSGIGSSGDGSNYALAVHMQVRPPGGLGGGGGAGGPEGKRGGWTRIAAVVIREGEVQGSGYRRARCRCSKGRHMGLMYSACIAAPIQHATRCKQLSAKERHAPTQLPIHLPALCFRLCLPLAVPVSCSCQAALALGGEHVLWKHTPAATKPAEPPPRQLLKVWPPPAPAASATTPAAVSAVGAGAGAGVNAAGAVGSAAASSRDFAALIQPLQVAEGEVTTAAAAGGGASSGVGEQPPAPRHHRVSRRKGPHVADLRREAAAAAAAASSPSKSSSEGGSHVSSHPHIPVDLSVVTPIQIQDALQNSCASLERLRTDVKSWTGRVAEGALSGGGSGQPLAPRAGVGQLLRTPPRGWSSFLPVPHVSVSGLLGVLARAPLRSSATPLQLPLAGGGGQQAGRSSSGGRSGGVSHPGAASTGSSSSPASSSSGMQPSRWGGLGPRQGSLAGAAASPARQLLAAGSGALEQTQQLLRGTSGGRVVYNSSIRPFACGGISCQFGQLRRNFFDFTRLEAACDLGLTGPELQQHPHQTLGGAGWANSSSSSGSGFSNGGNAAAGGGRHPALALEQKGVWHSLMVSATQQLVGPVRLRADWRWAVDSNVPCPRGSGLLQPKAPLQVLQHVGAMRPSLVDSAYGVDVMVPGTSGLARLMAWWSPGRREGMLEVRLL